METRDEQDHNVYRSASPNIEKCVVDVAAALYSTRCCESMGDLADFDAINGIAVYKRLENDITEEYPYRVRLYYHCSMTESLDWLLFGR